MNLEQKFSKDLAADLRDETAKKIKAVRARSLAEEIDKRKKKEASKEGILLSLEKIKREILNKLSKTDQDRNDQAFIASTFEARKEFDIKQIKAEYQEKFNEIMASCPLSEQEREGYLNTENLEKMPLDDYLVLLKRLSGEAFYHATKYGIRESHSITNRFNHIEKEGQFVDSLSPILADGKIRSMLSTIISNEEKINRIINPILLKSLKESGSSLEKAADVLLTTYYNANHPIDKESVHMSYGKELHEMYGGEKGYPIYFYYPVEYILQNDFFYSHRAGKIEIGSSNFKNQRDINLPHNDFEIFNFGEGVPVNAGILCIDGKIMVDSKTGSQYLLDEDGRPKFGDDGNYIKALETISAQEYWENYFKLHPELKPSKVMYESFSTEAENDNENLKEWAMSKDIFKQDAETRQAFRNHINNDREILKQVIMKAIAKDFENR